MSVEKLEATGPTIQNFISVVDSLTPATTSNYELSNLFTGFVRNGRISNLAEELPNENGLYITTSDSGLYTEPSSHNFSLSESLSVGRDDSRRGVFFGELQSTSFTNGSTKSLTVAVKPFLGLSNQRFAGNELMMYTALDAINLSHPNVLGFVVENSDTYMISEFKPGAIPQEATNWYGHDTSTVQELMKRGVRSLSEIHQYGIFHGDAYPRNVILLSDRNESWHVDMEHAVAASDKETIATETKQDLRYFYYGACKNRNVNPHFEEFDAVVFREYHCALLERYRHINNKKYITILLESLPQIYEDLKNEMNSDTDNRLGKLAIKYAQNL